jgi:integrase
LDIETINLFTAHRKRQLIERMSAGEVWQETGYIFVQENGLPIYPSTVTGLFLKLSENAGLRLIRLHDLRHIHATELLRLGEPLHVVAKRLGHRDAMVTATIYAHVSDQQAETASSRFAAAVSGNS